MKRVLIIEKIIHMVIALKEKDVMRSLQAKEQKELVGLVL
jgi:hypothetical protein